MNAHYNRSLLNTLRVPLQESLQQMADQCSQVVQGTRHPHSMDLGESANRVTGSLEMIGCTALAKVAATVETVCGRLPEYERNGWTHEQAVGHAQDVHVVIQAILKHLRDLAEDRADLPVRLWPSWARLVERMGEHAPNPEELFEIDPNFTDLAFATLDQEYLRKVVDSAIIRSEEVLALLAKAERAEEVEPALQKGSSLFDWLYGLLHRRGFQGYWLVLRARVALGLLQGSSAWWPKEAWTRLFDQALLELHKFREDNLKVQPSRLEEALAPLLQRWPLSWTVAHPALREFDQRFGMAGFWKTVDEVRDTQAMMRQEEFLGHQEAMGAKLMALRKAWNRHWTERGPIEDAQGVLLGWLEERPRFAPYGLDPLFTAFRRVADHLGQQKGLAGNTAASMEIARGVVWLEEFVAQPVRDDAALIAQAELIARRIDMALRQQSLDDLPAVRWTAPRRHQQHRKAMAIVRRQAHEDLEVLKETLDEWFRFKESETGQRLPEVVCKARQSADMLHVVGLTGAAEVLSRLADWIAAMQSHPHALPSGVSPERLAEGVAHLEAHLDALGRDDPEASRWLAMASQGVLEHPVLAGRRTPPPMANPMPEVLPLPSIADTSTMSGNVEAVPVLPTHRLAEEPMNTPPDDTDEWFNELGDVSQSIQPTAEPTVTPLPDNEHLARLFLEEADKVLGEMHLAHDQLVNKPLREDAWETLRRGFHTLKGSGRLVGFEAWGNLAGEWEDRVHEGELIHESYGPAWQAAFPIWMEWFRSEVLRQFDALEDGEPAIWDPGMARTALASLAAPAAASAGFDEDSEDAAPAENDSALTNADMVRDDAGLALADIIVPASVSEEGVAMTEEPPASEGPDPEVLALAQQEMHMHRGNLESLLEQGGPWEEAHRLVHTIASLAAMTGQMGLYARARAVEHRLENRDETSWRQDSRQLLEQWEDSQVVLPDSPGEIQASSPTHDDDWQVVFESLGAMADQIQRLSDAMERLWNQRQKGG
jgi:HPt (histidine-containing phosphotransfer) domain-containing protein